MKSECFLVRSDDTIYLIYNLTLKSKASRLGIIGMYIRHRSTVALFNKLEEEHGRTLAEEGNRKRGGERLGQRKHTRPGIEADTLNKTKRNI